MPSKSENQNMIPYLRVALINIIRKNVPMTMDSGLITESHPLMVS